MRAGHSLVQTQGRSARIHIVCQQWTNSVYRTIHSLNLAVLETSEALASGQPSWEARSATKPMLTYCSTAANEGAHINRQNFGDSFRSGSA